MTDTLGDILSKRSRAEPPEIRAVKNFVRELFQSDCKVSLKPGQLIVTVPNSALAGALRMHIVELRGVVGANLRVIIRIG